jgi:hypothetical protein
VATVASLTLIAVGFVVAMALVIVLARTSTARWERTGRAARAPRREVIAPGAALSGDAARQHRTAMSRLVAAAGGSAFRRASLGFVAGILVTAPKRVASRIRPFPRRTTDGSPAVPVDEEARQPRVPLVPERAPRRRAVRRHGVHRAAGHGLFHRGRRPVRRRTRGLLHRPDRTEESPALRADGDETLTGG